MNRRVFLALAVAAAGAVAVGIVLAALWPAADGREPEPGPRAVDLRPCRAILADDAAQACLARQFSKVLDGRRDPRPTVAEIAVAARRQGGFLRANCHVIMHTVGRTYARDARLTVATLMEHLPRSNDPGCSAGFAHGLVTAVAPDLDPSRPAEAASVCGKAGTRYQRYSCIHGFGHAFMRFYLDDLEPSLKLCRALGPESAPDCAQGAYHDYWFAVLGADDASLPSDAVTEPRRLCGAQPKEFVRGCWYRALLETRPEGLEVTAPGDLDALCDGLDGLQREACITAAAVIGPADPVEQIEICARMRAASDAANCVRGTKVQNLLDATPAAHVRLIRRCELFAGATRAACYRWLGKTLAVLTDGEFERTGCPRLRPGARGQCRAGARSMDQALVTFS
jgi:hypothetical protein